MVSGLKRHGIRHRIAGTHKLGWPWRALQPVGAVVAKLAPKAWVAGKELSLSFHNMDNTVNNMVWGLWHFKVSSLTASQKQEL